MKKLIPWLSCLLLCVVLAGCGLSNATILFENKSTTKPFTLTAEIQQLSDGVLVGSANDIASGASASIPLPSGSYSYAMTASDGSFVSGNVDLWPFQTVTFGMGN